MDNFMGEQSFIEKRRFPRINASLPLRYKELHGKTYLTKGTLTKNLSRGGARFSADRFFSLASHLMVEIKLPQISKPVRMLSKITWVKKLPAGDRYEIGSRFLAMTNEDETAVTHYTEKILNSAQK